MGAFDGQEEKVGWPNLQNFVSVFGGAKEVVELGKSPVHELNYPAKRNMNFNRQNMTKHTNKQIYAFG